MKNMAPISKHIPCKKLFLLKMYALMMAVVCLIVLIKSCGSHSFGDMIGQAVLCPTIMFIIVKPVFDLNFTRESMSSAKFRLPYQYIKAIRVDTNRQKVTIVHNYNNALCKESEKEYTYEINADNYETTIGDLILCFPENIKKIYV